MSTVKCLNISNLFPKGCSEIPTHLFLKEALHSLFTFYLSWIMSVVQDPPQERKMYKMPLKTVNHKPQKLYQPMPGTDLARSQLCNGPAELKVKLCINHSLGDSSSIWIAKLESFSHMKEALSKQLLVQYKTELLFLRGKKKMEVLQLVYTIWNVQTRQHHTSHALCIDTHACMY